MNHDLRAVLTPTVTFLEVFQHMHMKEKKSSNLRNAKILSKSNMQNMRKVSLPHQTRSKSWHRGWSKLSIIGRSRNQQNETFV